MIAPLMSFIVLSYNYQDYIGTTIRSILDQTVQDFEVIVVDDCSIDDSRAVVEAFCDPRIRLLVNDRNLGGAGSYNVAVQAARGEWLVNLDADDWIAPEKCAVQIAATVADPAIDIIGSWVTVVDADGAPHAEAPIVENHVNQAYALNLVDTWIGKNPLCRSSTMMRRAAHLRIGLDDASMVRAPDYELWTRALAAGCRFGLVHEKLTFSRLHERGVTHVNPAETFVEMSYAVARNLMRLAEARSLYGSMAQMLFDAILDPQLVNLTPQQADRLIGALAALPQLGDYDSFRAGLSAPGPEPMHERLGRLLRFSRWGQLPYGEIDKLLADVTDLVEARDFWHAQADNWQREYDFWHAQADNWQRKYDKLAAAPSTKPWWRGGRGRESEGH
jgi:GT2 family glycosyltransferase